MSEAVARWRASYAPGSWYVVSGPTALVVLEPGARSGNLVASLWPQVVAAASMADLVTSLAGFGVTELPDLAVFFWSPDGMRSLVRGRLRVMDAGSGQVVADGHDVLTWSESALRAVTRIQVQTEQAPALDAPELPLVVGVVTASRLTLDASPDAAVWSPQGLPTPAAAQPGAADASAAAGRGRTGSGEADTQQLPVMPSDAPEAAPGATFAADGIPEAASPALAAPEGSTGTPAQGGPMLARAEPAAAAAAAAATAAELAAVAGRPRPPTPPVELSGREVEWGQWGVPIAAVGTRAAAVASGSHPISGSAPALQPGESAPADPTGGAGPGSSPATQSPPAITEPLPPVATTDQDRDEGHPASDERGGDDRPTDALAAAATPSFDEEQFAVENDTTQLMHGADRPDPADAEGQEPGQPMVEGQRCPLGHANPPEADRCRSCGAPIPRRPPVLLPRPVLARLRAADGTVVNLDRVVLIGRAPSEQRSDAVLPRLMALASPGQDISRTHLQVAPEGWQVVVTDLHSTNGTYLLGPGTDGARSFLTPGEPTPVPLGSVLELGEGVTVSVEAPE